MLTLGTNSAITASGRETQEKARRLSRGAAIVRRTGKISKPFSHIVTNKSDNRSHAIPAEVLACRAAVISARSFIEDRIGAGFGDRRRKHTGSGGDAEEYSDKLHDVC